MGCEKIKAVLITDYLDARLEAKLKNSIDQHLEYCQDCRAYLLAIKKEIISPLNNVIGHVPGDELWAGIKEIIEQDNQARLKQALAPNFWENLRTSFHFPRPAFALASILTVILMIGTTGQFFINYQVGLINNKAQAEYINSLIAEPVGVDATNGVDLQSPIEKYFL